MRSRLFMSRVLVLCLSWQTMFLLQSQRKRNCHGPPLIVHTLVMEDALRAVELGAKRLAHPPLFGALERSGAAERLRGASIPLSTTFFPGAAQIPDVVVPMRELWDGGVTIAFGTDRFLNNPAEDISQQIEELNGVLSSTDHHSPNPQRAPR